MKLARAVTHGFHPTGTAKDFSRKFAKQVITEGMTLGELAKKRRK